MDSATKNFLLVVTACIIIIWVIYPIWSDCEPFDSLQPMHYDPNTKIATSQFVEMPTIFPPWGETNDKYGSADMIGDTIGIENPICSKSCCTPQYPPPFMTQIDDITDKYKANLIGTSYTCNNPWQNSGCMCLTQQQSDFLASRGNNTSLI